MCRNDAAIRRCWQEWVGSGKFQRHDNNGAADRKDRFITRSAITAPDSSLISIRSITAKQINNAKLPMKPVYPKPSYSFSKQSGLSIVQPAALLNGKQFVVEPVTTRNVTTQVGQTSYLHCIVDKLEDKTVGGLQRQVKQHVPEELAPSFNPTNL
ncbi:uncharacterized protein TNCV_2252291 [Trichonephila clavipes]|nr:uncharacterized protein TNCV_2252291 [Trichonephila clavipes]